MSSNILIKRICQQCGKTFDAKTTVTAYCGTPCARRAYKARKRAEKIGTSNEQTRQIVEKPIEEIRAKDFLNVADACTLFGVSRWTLWRAIKSGNIKAAKLRRRTLIRRADIDRLFDPGPLPAQQVAAPVALSDCYSLREIYEKYGVSPAMLYDLINRNAIPKQYAGSNAFVPKQIIDQLLNDLFK